MHLTDSKGNVVKNYNYDAFGNEEKIDANDKNPFRYGGEYWDSETGFYYLRARMYDPKIGRFINEDSYWGKDNDPLSLNLYTYCSNDPVDLIDPTGHMGWGQIDDLFGGIKDGMADSVKGIIKSPKVAYTIAKELIFGDLTLSQLAAAGIDGITADYRYVINHGGVFNPFKDSTDAQVRTFGKHTGGIISDIALALTGAGAGKAAQALSKSKSGQKILKVLDGACFTEETLIYTKDGYKTIKEIKVNDEVYSKNPETGEKGLKKVKNAFIKKTNTLIYLTIGDKVIKTTKDHPFWVKNKGWKPAGELSKDDELVSYDGKTVVKVSKVEMKSLQEPINVYNFEVEDWHTYFVGEDRVLVHNNNCAKGVAEALNKTTKNFWKSYNKLPKEIQKQADEAFKLFKENPNHPGLNFEQLSGGKYYSARINNKYRAYGRKLADGGIEWVEINGHDYNKAMRMLEKMK